MSDAASTSRVSSEEVPVTTESDDDKSKSSARKPNEGSGPVAKVKSITNKKSEKPTNKGSKTSAAVSSNVQSSVTDQPSNEGRAVVYSGQVTTEEYDAVESEAWPDSSGTLSYNSLQSLDDAEIARLRELSVDVEKTTEVENKYSVCVDLDKKPELIRVLKAEKPEKQCSNSARPLVHDVQKPEQDHQQWVESLTQRLGAGGSARTNDANEFCLFVRQLTAEIVDRYYRHRSRAPDTEVVVRVLAQIHGRRTLPVVDTVIRQRSTKTSGGRSIRADSPVPSDRPTPSSGRTKTGLVDPTIFSPGFPSFIQSDRDVKSERIVPQREILAGSDPEARRRPTRERSGRRVGGRSGRARPSTTASESGRTARRRKPAWSRELSVSDNVTRSLKETKQKGSSGSRPRRLVPQPMSKTSIEGVSDKSPTKISPSESTDSDARVRVAQVRAKDRERIEAPRSVQAVAYPPRQVPISTTDLNSSTRSESSRENERPVTRSGVAAVVADSVSAITSQSEQSTVYENAPRKQEFFNDSTTSSESAIGSESVTDASRLEDTAEAEAEDRTQHDEPEAPEGEAEEDPDFFKPSDGPYWQ